MNVRPFRYGIYTFSILNQGTSIDEVTDEDAYAMVEHLICKAQVENYTLELREAQAENYTLELRKYAQQQLRVPDDIFSALYILDNLIKHWVTKNEINDRFSRSIQNYVCYKYKMLNFIHLTNKHNFYFKFHA